MKLNSEEIVKILNVVIGKTQAVGLSHIDKDILENVEILAEVTDTLVTALFALIGIENGIGAWIDENKLS